MGITLAVIGGSGAYDLLTRKAFGSEEAPRIAETPFGPSSPLHQFSLQGIKFLFLSRHGETDYSITAPYVNYRANIYALKDSGVERIVAWSGPGIINTAFKPGEFAIPHDALDETRSRESTFFKNTGIGFIRQSDPFCPTIRQTLHDSLHQLGFPHHERGVYACTQGPRLETPAEIRKLRILEADLVGMTLLPEAFLARELEMCYAALCYLTNYAEGVVARKFQTGQLFEGMQNAEERRTVDESIMKFPAVLSAYLSRMQQADRACHCQEAMRRYRDKGMIDDDWHSWPGSP